MWCGDRPRRGAYRGALGRSNRRSALARGIVDLFSGGKEETVGNKDKGATKASKKVAQKSLKEKRQSKKTKRAASTGRAE